MISEVVDGRDLEANVTGVIMTRTTVHCETTAVTCNVSAVHCVGNQRKQETLWIHHDDAFAQLHQADLPRNAPFESAGVSTR